MMSLASSGPEEAKQADDGLIALTLPELWGLADYLDRRELAYCFSPARSAPSARWARRRAMPVLGRQTVIASWRVSGPAASRRWWTSNSE